MSFYTQLKNRNASKSIIEFVKSQKEKNKLAVEGYRHMIMDRKTENKTY